MKPRPEFQSVDEWLHYINMDKYSEVFYAANVNSLDKVTGLGDKELREMGINLIGHRNKMNKSIKLSSIGVLYRYAPYHLLACDFGARGRC